MIYFFKQNCDICCGWKFGIDVLTDIEKKKIVTKQLLA